MALSDCPRCWDTPCTCGYSQSHNGFMQRDYERDMERIKKRIEKLETIIKELK